MRTTLTLEDDLAHSLRERARLLKLPFKQVVNDALRQGLSQESDLTPKPKEAEEERPVFRVKPFAGSFLPAIDQDKLNQLNDDLQVEEFLHRLDT